MDGCIYLSMCGDYCTAGIVRLERCGAGVQTGTLIARDSCNILQYVCCPILCSLFHLFELPLSFYSLPSIGLLLVGFTVRRTLLIKREAAIRINP